MRIDLEGVSFGYSRRRSVLSNIDLQVLSFPLAILGPNGAGKSTLLSLIAGQFEPSIGQVRLATQSGELRANSHERRKVVSLMPQDIGAPRGFTVGEQITYSGWLKGMRYEDASRAAKAAAEVVDLDDLLRQSVRKLSGGQRRRLGIASAMVSSPHFLLLDEPYAGLDPEQRGTVRESLRRMKDTALIISTHQTDDIDYFYESVLIIDQGSALFCGSAKEFLRDVPAEVSTSDKAEFAYRNALRLARDGRPR